ncbi:MAG: DUF3089 domain-containing protein, partial [Chloroflexota bacterium]
FNTGRAWNAALDSPVLNQITDQGTLRHQASVFNGSAKIYAPRYRQATLSSFLDRTGSGWRALDLAYGDVKQAFEYYLRHFNEGRPIIVASHSQGSWHVLRLLADYFEGKPLYEQLVAAYAIGTPLPLDKFSRTFQQIKPAAGPDDTGCIVDWNTYAYGGNPTLFTTRTSTHYDSGWESNAGKALYCINPLNWRTDDTYASRDLNRGGALTGLTGSLEISPGIVDAQCQDGVLRIHEPPDERYQAILLPGKHYHVFDYSLFYMNIRENAQRRLDAYRRASGRQPGTPLPEQRARGQ